MQARWPLTPWKYVRSTRRSAPKSAASIWRSRSTAGPRPRILAAWHAHGALLIRNQKITDPQLIEFSRLFGELEMAPPNKSGSHWIEGYPELACISNITVNGQSIGSLGNGEAIWHTDMSFMERAAGRQPALCASRSRRQGGATHLANMYRAYETLPDDLKRRVEGRIRRARRDLHQRRRSAEEIRGLCRHDRSRAERPARGIRWCASIRRPDGRRSISAANPARRASWAKRTRRCGMRSGRIAAIPRWPGRTTGRSAIC